MNHIYIYIYLSYYPDNSKNSFSNFVPEQQKLPADSTRFCRKSYQRLPSTMAQQPRVLTKHGDTKVTHSLSIPLTRIFSVSKVKDHPIPIHVFCKADFG